MKKNGKYRYSYIFDLLARRSDPEGPYLGSVQHMNAAELCAYATEGRLDDVVMAIETHGVDANCVDGDGATPLVLSAHGGFISVVEYLVQTAKADVNKVDHDGVTPLLVAAGEGHVDVVSLLVVEGKADVNIADRDGVTALLAAAGKGHKAVVRCLVEDGHADVNLPTHDGLTPLFVANSYGHQEVADYLVQHGAAAVVQFNPSVRVCFLAPSAHATHHSFSPLPTPSHHARTIDRARLRMTRPPMPLRARPTPVSAFWPARCGCMCDACLVCRERMVSVDSSRADPPLLCPVG